jgi:AcrR family transcriptional regulator
MPATKVEKIKWLKLGIQRFSVLGIEGINVEQMAKKLDCNKSSFYWHFKSKENFLNEIILFWFENSIKPITTQLDKNNNPIERFEKFILLSFQDKSRKDLMFYLRKVSEKNTQLKKLLNTLTNMRLVYTAAIIQELGYTESEAQLKAEILLNFYVGWYEMNKNIISNDDKNIQHALKLIKNFIKF